LEILIIALCLSIGTAVAWLVALYSERGPYLLIWDNVFGMAGAGLCAAAIAWLTPAIGAVGVVIAGPLCAYLAILAGQKIRRAMSNKTDFPT
jgi:O-antigen/teichoic acid export membrane protein